jgi:hypothetical protein
VLLVAMNWVYTKWFFEKDLLEHSDIIELPRQVVADSCQVVYLGESSNNTYGYAESDHRKISAMVSAYFPKVRLGDMTKSASHAQTYYTMLKQVPKDAPVETVIVTMNLRSFDAGWIYSRLETALRKQIVLLQDYPPLMNRFLLAFKAYPIRSEEEWDAIARKHWKKDPLDFPYDFEWNNTHQWDSAMAWGGWQDFDGQRDQQLTELACHYIKSYAFQIRDDNPRIKDFDAIVDLCRERGWHLIFNLMAENVDKANELVGKDLLFLMKQNRDYLMQRYDTQEDVTVVNNLDLVRDVNFIDQDWTTEHYYGEGRRIIAHQVAQALRQYYPNEYQDLGLLQYEAGHYCFEGSEDELNVERPYSQTLILPADSLQPDWGMVNIAVEMLQPDTLNDAQIVIEKNGEQGKTSTYYDLGSQIQSIGKWEFATFALPIDSTFREAEQIKFFVYNPSTSSVRVRRFDISFRPAYLKPAVKAQSSR